MAYAGSDAILGRIRNEIGHFETTDVVVVDGYPFNQRRTLRKIELYYGSKFETGPMDSEGFHKFFYNVVHFPCDVATKAIDLDTKDFRLIPESQEAQIPTLFLQKELKDWMKATSFGTVLNEIVEDLPKYGSVVVKKHPDDETGEGISVVNIHNLVCDPTVKALADSSYILERHVYTPDELRGMAEYGWDADAIEDTINLYATDTTKNQIVVWERWGYLTKDEYGEKTSGKAPLYCMCIVAGVEKAVYDPKTSVYQELGRCLYKSEADKEDMPYRDVHWEKIKGRWLGVGLVERNFEGQVRMNEIQNIKSKALYWASKIVFQSRDKTVARNLLTDMQNGDILRVDSEITQIDTKLNDLGAFQQEEQRWDDNIAKTGFVFESETGETLPSGTPFRLGAMLKAGSGGFFNFKREKVGLFLRDLFLDVIIPAFKNSKRRKHLLTIPKDEKDLNPLLEKYADVIIYANVQEYAERTGFFPSVEQLQMERQRLLAELQSRKNIFIEIPDSFYKNAKFSMDLVITDEQVDVGQKLETIANLIQLVGANPSILEDERTRNMVFAALNLAGVSPIELGIDKPSTPAGMAMGLQPGGAQGPEQPTQPGAPMPPGTPTTGNTTQTV